MIIAIANVNILLPCLAVLCALLAAGVITLSILLAVSKRKDRRIMQQDVYIGVNDALNIDCDKNGDEQIENIQDSEGNCNED